MNQEIVSLRRGSVELTQALYEGVVWRHGESWQALPREVSAQSVVFELIRRDGWRSERSFSLQFLTQWMAALRLERVILERVMMTGLPALSLLALGLSQGLHPEWWVGFFAYLGVLCIHLAVHFLNGVADHMSLAQPDGGTTRAMGLGVIQRGWLSAKQLRLLGFIFLALGAVFGFPAVLHSPAVLLLVGAIGVFGVLGYSGRTFLLRKAIAGDFIIGLLFGPLLCIGYSLAFFETLSAGTVVLGLFFGFLAWTVHHAEHLSQLGFTPSSSFAAWIGFRSARTALVLGYGLGLGCLLLAVALGWLSPWVGFLPWVALPALGFFLRRVYQASGPSSALMRGVTEQASELYGFLGLVLLLGILFSYLFS